MIDLRAVEFPQPDQQHFHQPAFDPADEHRVRFHARAKKHVIGLMRQPVEINRKSLVGLPQHDRIHAGADRAAAKFLGDAVGRENFLLPRRGAAAVASHGWHEKRLRIERLLEISDHAAEDHRDLGDPSAAGGDRDRLTRPNRVTKIQAFEPRRDLRGDVRHAAADPSVVAREIFADRRSWLHTRYPGGIELRGALGKLSAQTRGLIDLKPPGVQEQSPLRLIFWTTRGRVGHDAGLFWHPNFCGQFRSIFSVETRLSSTDAGHRGRIQMPARGMAES